VFGVPSCRDVVAKFQAQAQMFAEPVVHSAAEVEAVGCPGAKEERVAHGGTRSSQEMFDAAAKVI